MTLAPVIAISHGGGPLPIIGGPGHDDIVYSLKERVPKVLKLGTPSQPRAIVLVTAHWQTSKPTITSAKAPGLLYDYYGFPPEAYDIKFPAPGEPAVAQQVFDALKAEGIDAELDEDRGWDHGVFVPMLLTTPKADVPIVQVSILASQDPAAHLRMGAALARLRADNIAIMGSGFASFHNLRHMRTLMSGLDGTELLKQSKEWNEVLTRAVGADKEQRWRELERWRDMPHADVMHPPRGGDHFMPLLVCAAAADEDKAKSYVDKFMGVDIYTYYWGDEAS